ncbi:MAG TPA: hypothetical protein VJQ43_02210, partial [Thermoplasmata archaeon]|nr:hypothetical protein [Thermoplasmata archaeon]
KYPPKDAGLGTRPTPPAARTASSLPSTPTPSAPHPSVATGPAKPLIALERPFDIDEFAGMLGETVIRTEIPREDLAEALRRVSEFMGFGIYVYAVRVRPAKDELLTRFVVELQRVDYDPATGDWVPFAESGRSDSPFGPTGGRR